MMERDRTENNDEAPNGTYDFLKRLSGRIYNDNDPTQHRGCSIQEESFCPETGGSCIDLRILKDKDGVYTELHAHITDKNRVVTLEGNNYNPRTDDGNRFKPDLSTMIDTVKAIRPSFETDPYERPIR